METILKTHLLEENHELLHHVPAVILQKDICHNFFLLSIIKVNGNHVFVVFVLSGISQARIHTAYKIHSKFQLETSKSGSSDIYVDLKVGPEVFTIRFTKQAKEFIQNLAQIIETAGLDF
jgi:hypothetical protein